MERRYGGFSRSIDLPSSVDTNKVPAEYKTVCLDYLAKERSSKPKTDLRVKVQLKVVRHHSYIIRFAL